MSKSSQNILFDFLIPLAIVLLIMSGLHLLSSEEIATTNSSNRNYEVICKHPEGNILKYTVDQNNWSNLHNSRNSIWKFTDITGNSVKLSGPCYTDNKETK